MSELQHRSSFQRKLESSFLLLLPELPKRNAHGCPHSMATQKAPPGEERKNWIPACAGMTSFWITYGAAP
jgi:hypothetical protein